MTHFDKAAENWDEPWKIESSKLFAKKIKECIALKEDISILDFGCGTGLLGGEFLTSKNKLLGIDPSEGMLEIFNKKFINADNVRSTNINLEKDSTDEKFDLIISAMAFHHLDNPKQMYFKLISMLKDDGILAIVDLDEEDGTFHPDNKAMGVKHFGFSKKELLEWSNLERHKNLQHHIINKIEKNDREYAQFLAIYS